jgi:hypothetical protein
VQLVEQDCEKAWGVMQSTMTMHRAAARVNSRRLEVVENDEDKWAKYTKSRGRADQVAMGKSPKLNGNS